MPTRKYRPRAEVEADQRERDAIRFNAAHRKANKAAKVNRWMGLDRADPYGMLKSEAHLDWLLDRIEGRKPWPPRPTEEDAKAILSYWMTPPSNGGATDG